MIRVVAVVLGAWVLQTLGVIASHWLQPLGPAASYWGSLGNLVAMLAMSPVLVLAQTVPAFGAGYYMRRHGAMVGGAIGVPYFLLQLSQPIQSIVAEGTLTHGGSILYVPGIEAASSALAGVVLGAIAGAAGQAIRNRLPSNDALERERGQ